MRLKAGDGAGGVSLEGPEPSTPLYALCQYPFGNNSPISCLRIFLRAKYCRGKLLKFFSSSIETEVTSMVFTFSHLGRAGDKEQGQGSCSQLNMQVVSSLLKSRTRSLPLPFLFQVRGFVLLCPESYVVPLTALHFIKWIVTPQLLALLCSQPLLPSSLNTAMGTKLCTTSIQPPTRINTTWLCSHCSGQAWPHVKREVKIYHYQWLILLHIQLIYCMTSPFLLPQVITKPSL